MAGVLDLPTLIQKVRLDADTKGAEGETKGAISRIGSTMTKVGAGLTAGLTVPIVGLAISGVKAASDLSESNSKVGVVFDQNADKVRAFAKDAASSMGISQQAALEATGTFGNLFRALGVGTGPAAEMSTHLVSLASDLASFNNADPAEVLQALQSGLLGEAEPMRKFGVSLSAARIESEALSSGLVKATGNSQKIAAASIAVEKAHQAAAKAAKEHGKESLEYRDAAAKAEKAESALTEATKGQVPELTAAQKAQAAYAIIQKDTSLAQGDFARTSGGLANQQRIVAAQFTDLRATLGTALLPVIQKVVGVVSGLLKKFQDLSPTAKSVVLVVVGIAAAIGPLLLALGAIIPAITAVAGVLTGGFIAAALPVVAVVAAVAAGAIILYKNWDRIAPILEKVTKTISLLFGAFKSALSGEGITENSGIFNIVERLGVIVRDAVITVQRWLQTMMDFFRKIAPDVQEALGHVMAAITFAMKIVVEAIKIPLGVLAALWRAWGDDLWSIVQAIFGTIQEVIRGAVEVVRGIIVTVMALINGDWGKAWDGIKGIIDGIWDAIIGVFRGAFNIISALVGGYLSTIIEIWKGFWGVVGGIVQGAWDFVIGIFTGAWNFIVSIFQAQVAVIVGIWNGLVSFIAGIGAAISAIFSTAAGWFKGLIDGITGAATWVHDRVTDITDLIASIPGRILGVISEAGSAAAKLGKAIIESIVSGIQLVGGFFGDLGKSVANTLIEVLNKNIIDRINDVHIEILGKTIDFPNIPRIPHLALGGLYGGPFVAGERGPELVFPNSPQGRVLSHTRSMDLLEDLASRTGGSGGRTAPLIGQQIIQGLTGDEVTAATMRAHRKMVLSWEVS